jgi:hypothetical protein
MIHHLSIVASPEGLPEIGPDIHPGIDQIACSANISALIRSGRIRFGGNKTLKIYGALSCSSGKRMKVKNRVFFESEAEAQQAGYRPCGHCMREKYKLWKTA